MSYRTDITNRRGPGSLRSLIRIKIPLPTDNSGTLGRWDHGTVGRWDGGTVKDSPGLDGPDTVHTAGVVRAHAPLLDVAAVVCLKTRTVAGLSGQVQKHPTDWTG